jgi:four helix bundle protein
MAHRFRDLEIWKLSRILCSDIYKITSKFPDTEKFGLTNQLRRASVSVPSNIVEGSSRMSNKDFSRFLEIAIGSMYEILTQLLIALDLTYITEDEQQTLNNSLDVIVKMTSSFRSTLK